MAADGGMSQFPSNKAGAKYGTGYCDTQCPRDIKFINGEANVEGWSGSPNDTNAGTGNLGACCNEMDIWEANSIAAAYTPNSCTVQGQFRCSGADCGTNGRYDTVCDPDGCDFNSYRMGDTEFYGPGGSGVDTGSPFTVVTQFLTNNNSSSGTLSEIRRLYVQNGVVVQNSKVNIPGMDAYDFITADFCDSQKSAFGDTTSFQDKGVNMLWLDSDADPSKSGIKRGTYSTDSGKPTDIENSAPNSSVTFSKIRFGDIGTTYSDGDPTSASTAPGTVQTKDGQCGGQGWTGPTQCESGSTCQVSNPWYSQCL